MAPTYICANLNVAPLGSTAAFTAASSALSPMNSTTTPLKEPGDACLNALSSTCAVVDELGRPPPPSCPARPAPRRPPRTDSGTLRRPPPAADRLPGPPPGPAPPPSRLPQGPEPRAPPAR